MEDLAIFIRRKNLELSAGELTAEENHREMQEEAHHEEAQEPSVTETNIIFPDEFIARLDGLSQGLGMFLKNVSSGRVRKMLNLAFTKLDTNEKMLLSHYYKLYDDDARKFCDGMPMSVDPLKRLQILMKDFAEELHEIFRKALFENRLEAKLSLSRVVLLEKNITDLNISNRSTSSLLRVDITTVEKMLNWYESNDPKNIRNLGPKSFKEIQDFIKLYKLHPKFSVIA